MQEKHMEENNDNEREIKSLSELNILLLPLGSYINTDPYNGASQLFYLWNLHCVLLSGAKGSHASSYQVEDIFDAMTKNNLCENFFTSTLFTNISSANFSSLVYFLESFLVHILHLDHHEPHHLVSLSNLILLSWWTSCFQEPPVYCLLASGLHASIRRSISLLAAKTDKGNIWDLLGRLPELANVFVTELLRIFTECETARVASEIPLRTSGQDVVSRTVGLHASACLSRLASIYRDSLFRLGYTIAPALEPVDSSQVSLRAGSVTYEIDRDSVVTLLHIVIRHDLGKSLRQAPDLPLPETLFNHPLGRAGERYLLARNYFQLRASRLIATALQAGRLPSEFSRLLHDAASKRVVTDLLLPAAADKHADLICWALDRGLCVREYAFWLVNDSDPKNTRLCDCALHKLLKHVQLLADDSSFCLALILRLDRVRLSTTLPTHAYEKLFRLLITCLSPNSKADLLRQLHDPARNPGGARPLQRSPVSHFDAQLRSVLNRLSVVGADDSDGGSTVMDASELVTDAEVLLLTLPVEFLSKLICLPVDRKCASSQPAVHQLLNRFTAYFAEPLLEVTTSLTRTRQSGVGRRDGEDSGGQAVGDSQQLSLLAILLLSDLLFPARPKTDQPTLFPDKVAGTDGSPVDMVGDRLSVDLDALFVESGEPVDGCATVKELQALAEKERLTATVAHLFSLCPHQIGPVFFQLTFHLSCSAGQTTTTALPLVYRLVSAVSQLITERQSADHPLDQLTEAQRDDLLCQLVHLYTCLFLTSTDEQGSVADAEQLQDCDHLLALLLTHLVSAWAPPPPATTDSCYPKPGWHCQLARLRHQLISTRGAHSLRHWLLLVPVFARCLALSDDCRKPLTEFTECVCGASGGGWPAFGRWLDLDLLKSRLSLDWPTAEAPAEEEKEDSYRVGQTCPHLIHLVLLLASVSTNSHRVVLEALGRASRDSSSSLGKASPRPPPHFSESSISTGCLLVALLAFLQHNGRHRHPGCWSRVLIVVLHMLSRDLVTLALPMLADEDKQKVTGCAAPLHLYDWSGLRSSFDFFHLSAKLTHLWLLLTASRSVRDLVQLSSDRGDHVPQLPELILLTSTVSVAVQRVVATTEQHQAEAYPPRFRRIVLKLALQLIGHCCVGLLSPAGLQKGVASQVHRLCAILATARERLTDGMC